MERGEFGVLSLSPSLVEKLQYMRQETGTAALTKLRPADWQLF
jgi:hypothetical protein